MAEAAKAVYTGPVFTGTLNGTVSKYDFVGHNGTGFVQADADWTAANPLYARGIAMQDGISGDVIQIATEIILNDVDAPYTEDAAYYLSATAGASTTTAPTAADDLVQSLGAAKDTKNIHYKIDPPRLVTYVYNPQPIYTINEGGAANPVVLGAVLDSGNMGGLVLDAQNEALVFNVVWPRNALLLERANLWLAAEATAGTPTFDMTTSIAVDGEQWDAATQDTGIANSAAEGAAADEIQMTAVTAGMNLTDHGPGSLLGVKIVKDDAGTDSSNFFALEVVWRCVN